MRLYILFSLLFFPFIINAQAFSDSNLPIVIINTSVDPVSNQPRNIPDEVKVPATMKIINRTDGSRNYLTDQNDTSFLNYNGHIGIEIRGSSSQFLDKKSYGLTTFTSDDVTLRNVSILGMPAENDWILNSLGMDPSLIRNYLSYDLARSLGDYTPRCVFCEVLINGEYKGLYMFMEKIKIDAGRVNIVKMTNLDINGNDLTGGYLIKADKTTGGDPVAWSMLSYNGTTDFIYETPKAYEITAQQRMYISSVFYNFQKAIASQNASVTTGYPSFIDIPSFVDYMIISEITSNADAYQYSTYFHKDKMGKLRAGPIWDYDLTFGNDIFMWGFNRSLTNVWQFDNGDNTGPKFWKDLFNNPTFRCYFTKRWKELNSSGNPLSYDAITTKMDQIVLNIAEAAKRENYKWGNSYNQTGEVAKMKIWLQSRIDFINNNLSNYQSCANPVLPALVISKINYNPVATPSLLSKDLEFIEVTNNSDKAINLSGIYFKELGLSYQFPANSTLAPYEKLILASDETAFKQFYGASPFGKYAKNLSDTSEKLVMADAFGNVIDEVEYKNIAPWPTEAAGNGYFLQLNDVNADNNKAENWTISSHLALDAPTISEKNAVRIYPKPVTTNLFVEAKELSLIEISDLRGQKVITKIVMESGQSNIDVHSLQSGIYLLKLNFRNGESKVEKFNKLP